MKKKIGIIIIIFSIAYIYINGLIIKEAHTLEKNNKVIEYSYDDYNYLGTASTETVNLQVDEFNAINTEKEDGVYHVEFEKTFFGTLKIVFQEETEDELPIRVVLGEMKSENGYVWTRDNIGENDLKGFGINYVEKNLIIPKGVKEYKVVMDERPIPLEKNIDNGNWSGGVFPIRYCDIAGLENYDLDNNSFIQLAVHKKNFSENSFASDNAELDNVYSLCKHTIDATTYAGIYIDGYRELRPYEADTYINELGSFCVDSDYSMAKKTLEFILYNHTWPTEWVELTIPCVYEYYMYSGDLDFLVSNWDAIEECLLEDMKNEQGLIDSKKINDGILKELNMSSMRDIIDWPVCERDNFATDYQGSSIQKIRNNIKSLWYGYKAYVSDVCGFKYASSYFRIYQEGIQQTGMVIESPNAVVNALYYNNLQILSFLSQEIGDEEKASNYANEAKAFFEIYNKAFVDEKTGLVRDTTDIEENNYSLHANVMALNYGLIKNENKERVIDYIKSKKVNCSVYTMQYLLESLVKNGEVDYALDLITSNDDKSWIGMINSGSSLTTEAWNENIKLDMDYSHAWGTAPLNILLRQIVGVKPAVAGCEEIIIEPNLGYLEHVSSVIPMNNGVVTIECKKSNSKMKVKINTNVKSYYVIPTDMTLLNDDKYDIQIYHNKKCIILNGGEYLLEFDCSE